MKNHLRISHPWPVLALLVLGIGPLVAQEPALVSEPSVQTPFVDQVRVELVEVDVFVTDRKGNPIEDLTEADFEIFEDGNPVAISHFRPPMDAAVAMAATPRPRLEIPGQETPIEAAVEVEEPHYLVVYIDNLNIKPFERNRVFRSLRNFLGREVDRRRKTMLVSYTRSLKERVPFTSDPSVVSRGLLELERESALGTSRESERNDILRQIEEADSAGFAISQARLYASSYHNDMMFTIDALRETVDSLAGLPGRKALLYVSGGVPEVPGEELFYAIQDRFKESSTLMESREFDVGRRFRELAHVANTNGVTFYTIDAAGLRSPSAASAARNVVSSAALLDSHHIHNLQAPLIQLARDTGGQAIINTNDPTDELDAVRRDFERYYSLGYQPSHSGDGRYHQIEVKVRTKGAKVRHRQGYRGRTLEQRMSDATQAALLFREVDNGMDLEVSVGEIQRSEDRFSVPITLRVPIDEVVFLERGEHHEASLELFFSALDAEGGMSPVQQVRVPLQIESTKMSEAAGKRFGYEFSLKMRGGDHRVAIGLYDNLGGDQSFVIGELNVAVR